jgi:hypothetical protein
MQPAEAVAATSGWLGAEGLLQVGPELLKLGSPGAPAVDAVVGKGERRIVAARGEVGVAEGEVAADGLALE